MHLCMGGAGDSTVSVTDQKIRNYRRVEGKKKRNHEPTNRAVYDLALKVVSGDLLALGRWRNDLGLGYHAHCQIYPQPLSTL